MNEAGLLSRKLIGIEEASHYLGLSKDMIYKLVSQRRIPFTKLTNRLKFRIDLLDEWIKQKTVMPVKSRIGAA